MPDAGALIPPEKGMAETPELLADTLIRALGPSGEANASWLDPSVGAGRLVEAALRAGVDARAIFAVDLQSHLPGLERLGIESLLGTDFLRWAGATRRRFDRVIANPPYVRLGDLHEDLFRSAIDTHLNGICVPATANYWVPFLIAGMRLLRHGGSLAYILPAAWEYADYAGDVRRLCAASFRELDVHRVSVPMFEGVLDGSILLVARGYAEMPGRAARVFRYSTLEDLNQAICARKDDGTEMFTSPMRGTDISIGEGEVRLGRIAQVRVGAVTGDARYFLLRESRRLDLGLPRSTVRPILSKARHIVRDEINHGVWCQLLAEDKRVWLFKPSGTDLSQASVRAYMELSAEDGGCRRAAFKIRDRNPWYRVPLPDRFDGFVSGMSSAITWIALNRMPDLTISNTLYGVRFLGIDNVDRQAAWCLSMLSSVTARSRSRLAREYPQGLLKLEPGDFARLAVRSPPTRNGARGLYRRAVNLMAAGEREEAQALADDWLDS